MSGKLSGKVAIVTGGAGGFGKGIAEKFKQEGAEVIIADFVEEAGQKTASELKCEFQKCNVTSRQDWEALLKFADEKYGRVDCVVRSVGEHYPLRTNGLTFGRLTTLVLHIGTKCVLNISIYLEQSRRHALTMPQSQQTKSRTKTSTNASPSTSKPSTTRPTSSYPTCKKRATAAPS